MENETDRNKKGSIEVRSLNSQCYAKFLFYLKIIVLSFRIKLSIPHDILKVRLNAAHAEARRINKQIPRISYVLIHC